MIKKLSLANHSLNKHLVKRLKSGDMSAFDEIYHRYGNQVFAFIFKFIKNEQDTEEITQEVFVKLWESRNKLNTYQSFDSFLFTVAYNLTISLFRKRISEKKYINHLQSIQSQLVQVNVIDKLQYEQLNEQVAMLIEKLPTRQKEVFKMSRQQGMTYQEIASRLGLSVNTVENHMVKALSFLKSNLDNSLLINLFYIFLFLS